MNKADLVKSHRELSERAAEWASGRREGNWWCVNGYANILNKAILRIEQHEKRCRKVYGEQAIPFDDALTPDGQSKSGSHDSTPEASK